MKVTWQATVVTVAMLAFVFGIIWLAIDHGVSFSDAWAAVGTFVGVLTGAAPAYFYASNAQTNATKSSDIARVYAEHLDPAAVAAVQTVLQARKLA
jgi:hypothetical protein